MRLLKQALGVKVALGGGGDSGWLPPNAARPASTPDSIVTLDVRLFQEAEAGGGFILEWTSPDGGPNNDLWFATLEEALAEGQAIWGGGRDEWRDP